MLTCGLVLVLYGVTYSWIHSLFSSQVLIRFLSIIYFPPPQPVGFWILNCYKTNSAGLKNMGIVLGIFESCIQTLSMTFILVPLYNRFNLDIKLKKALG